MLRVRRRAWTAATAATPHQTPARGPAKLLGAEATPRCLLWPATAEAAEAADPPLASKNARLLVAMTCNQSSFSSESLRIAHAVEFEPSQVEHEQNAELLKSANGSLSLPRVPCSQSPTQGVAAGRCRLEVLISRHLQGIHSRPGAPACQALDPG